MSSAEHLKPHRFTSETAREAQKRGVEARRRNARAAREKLGVWLEKDLKEAYDAYRRGFTAGEKDDWRAADAALTQVYGRPPTELELSAGAAGAVSITLQSCFSLDPPADDEQAEESGDQPEA
jgi:hypothetical protein